MGQIGDLDPPKASARAAFLVLATACDGLTALDPSTGTPKPALAQSWSFDAAAQTLTIHLRPNTFYSGGPTGTAVDAASVAESLSRVVRPETSSPWAGLLSEVAGFDDVRSGKALSLAGVKAVDASTVEIDLTHPFADLPSVLAFPALVPVAGPSGQTSASGPSCAGPYRFEQAAADNEVRITRNAAARTRSEAYAGQGRGYADVITFRSYDTEGEAFDAYKKGEAAAAPVPQERVGEAINDPAHAQRQTAGVTYLAVDVTKSPTDNPALRKAMALGLDRLAIIDAAFGDERRPAVRWLAGLEASNDSPCTLGIRRIADSEKAKAMLAAAHVDPGSVKLAVTFDSSQTSQLLAQAIQVELKDNLGISPGLQSLDPPAFQASLQSRAQPAIWIVNHEADLPIPARELALLFHSASPGNFTGFSDPSLDLTLDRAASTVDTAGRRNAYLAAQDEVCDKMPAIPLWFGVRHWMANPAKVTFKGSERIDVSGALIMREASGT